MSARPKGSGGAGQSAVLPRLDDARHRLRRGVLQLAPRRSERDPLEFFSTLLVFEDEGHQQVDLIALDLSLLDVESLFLTFVRRGDRWYVAADADLAPLGVDGFRGLWDQGPVAVQRTAHFLVLSHPPDAGRARNLAAVAEEAIARLDQRWTEPWSHRVPLILPASVDELGLILQSTFDLDNFVAFVAYGAVRDRDWEATAPRIYIQDRNLSRYGRDDQVRTLTHELDHVAVAPIAGPSIPSWVHEGVADWVALGRRTDERDPAGSDGHLPLDYEFTVGGRDAINLSYAESRSVMSFLAARRGVGAPAELIRTLGAEKVVPGSEELQVDQALTRVAGLDTAQLEKEWAAR